MRFKNISAYILFGIILSMVGVSCATKKRKEDVSGLKKFYHNTTSKYNGYFNANEIMKEVNIILENSHQDNYTDVLEVYPTNNPQTAKTVSPQLDIAIEKVTTVATLHDVGDWVDDCYVLMGTAQYLKQDYESAQQTLEFFQKEYNPDDPASRNYKKKALSPQAKRKQREETKAIEREERLESRKEREKEREIAAKEREELKRQEEKDRKESQKQREKEKKELEKQRKKEVEERKKERKQSAEQQRKERLKARKEQQKTGRSASRSRTKTEQTTQEDTIPEIQEDIPQDSVIALISEDTSPAENNSIEEGENSEVEVVKAEINNNEDEKEENPGTNDADSLDDIESKPKKNQKAKIEKTRYHEGVLWLARTYVQRERYSSADYLLKRMWDDPTVKKEVKREIPAAQAFSSIAQKKYSDAIVYLELAIEHTKRKKDKARYAYILAQLEEINGNYIASAEHYKLAKKYGATYEMELNAELNMIKNDLFARKITTRSAEDELLKLRKANKNEEFRDRISYILSDIAFSSDQENKGITYLQEALGFNQGDQNLKREAYYKLADFYYTREDFINAKYYYDSTLMVLNDTDPRYKNVQALASNLDLISRYMNVVILQDSLLAIAALPEEDQIEYAKNIIREKEKNQQENPVESAQNPSDNIKTTRRSATTQSSFFAYNKQVADSGKQAFKDKWGERLLQDNWRRKDATGIFSGIDTELASENIEAVEKTISEDEIREVLQRIPNTPASAKGAHLKIEDALFELGKQFKDKLDHSSKSLATHDELLKRYPDSNNKLNALYYMYLNSQDLNDYTSADRYRLAIIDGFPESNFAKILNDPNYAAELLDKDRELINFYNSMYIQFENKNFATVKSMYEESISKFGQSHDLRPKFSLLHAISLGSVEGEQQYVDALQDLIRRYPNTPEQTRAREILRFLKGDQAAFNKVEIAEVDGIFEKEDDKLHYLVIVLYDSDDEIFNNVRISISNYNKDKHKEKRLQISDIGLNKTDNSKIILVRKFNNKTEAMEYYYDITKNAGKFIDVNGVNYETYPVTQRNYRKIIDQKGANKYRVWFENHYLASN